MATKSHDLHVVIFPFPVYGHMIPALDVARLFATRNSVKATIITTPLNVPFFTNSDGNPNIDIEVFRFPSEEVGLPKGIEMPDLSLGPTLFKKFFKATELFSKQLDEYLERVRPNCIVADMFFPWATSCAVKFDVPRIVFHGTSNFSLCVQEIIRVHEPYNRVSSDEEPFVLPSLPDEVKLTRSQISEALMTTEETEFKRRNRRVKESELESYGVIVNSCYNLEPDYAEFFKKELGRRSWNIGPVSLINKSMEHKAHRGKQASIEGHECLEWLNSKKMNSVVYICFGSGANLIAPQLFEIATALEASKIDFIWVIRNFDSRKNEEFLPKGFEQRTQGKGLIIRGWAPQVLILEHEAIGAFVTHCGWNSTLEGITTGVPMITWPIFAEQFYNEKLVTQILKTGIPIGMKKWNSVPLPEDVVKQESIVMALRKIMEGNEAEERRSKAKNLKKVVEEAMEDGGSSHLELSALIVELRNYHHPKQDGKI